MFLNGALSPWSVISPRPPPWKQIVAGIALFIVGLAVGREFQSSKLRKYFRVDEVFHD